MKTKKSTESRNSQLCREFNCSRITVYYALRGVTDSELAKKIRSRNKGLLEAEIKKMEDIDSEHESWVALSSVIFSARPGGGLFIQKLNNMSEQIIKSAENTYTVNGIPVYIDSDDHLVSRTIELKPSEERALLEYIRSENNSEKEDDGIWVIFRQRY